MKSSLLFVMILLCPCFSLAQSVPSVASSSSSVSASAKNAGTKPSLNLPIEKREPVRIAHFDKAPVIDGKLDDEVWSNAIVLKDFFQIQPGENLTATKQAEVLIGYDARTLYIAFRAPDDQGQVRATVAKRDQIFDDDYVGFYLDTFNDRRRAYALFFNPLGIQADGIVTEGRGEDYSVDIVLESKGVVTDNGFTVEIAVPFKSLRYEAGKGKIWGAHFFRRIKRFNNELDSWMPVSRDKSGFLNQEGHLTGFEGISTERTLEIIPSLTLLESGQRVRSIPASVIQANPGLLDPGRFVNRPVEFDPGLTLKLGITPTIALDVAINPDFAQVEADQAVIRVNQRFPIFFEEKRPFFFEGKDYFETSMQAVHTRAIVDPDYAVKLTGRRGQTTFGLLMASDNAPGNFSEDERNDPDNRANILKFLDKNAYIGVLRLKRDFGQESSIGLIATSYNFIEKHNQLAGIDGRFRLNPKTVLNFQVLGTTSRRNFYEPELDRNLYRTGNGIGYRWDLDMAGRHFGYFVRGEGRTRDYRADMGFTRRTNTNEYAFFSRYASEPKPKATLISWRLAQYSSLNFDYQGRLQNWITEPTFRMQFKRQTYFGIGYTGRYERIFEEEFGAKRTAKQAGAFFGNNPERSTSRKEIFGFTGTNPNKKYNINFFGVYRWGEFDYDFGGGRRFPRVSPAALIDSSAKQDPGAGNSLNIEASFTYQPTNALRLSLDYNKSRLERYDTGRVAFDDNLYSFRSTYQFTRFISARARVDYSTLTGRVFSQFLWGWTPNPGTSFYVGYNDDMMYNGYSPFTDQREPGIRRTGRTFYIKMSYLIRKSL